MAGPQLNIIFFNGHVASGQYQPYLNTNNYIKKFIASLNIQHSNQVVFK